MSEFPEPDKIIDIELPKVAKKGLYVTGLALVVLVMLHFLLEKKVYLNLSLRSVLFFVVGYVVLIILHEFFHLLGFRMFAQVPWRKMEVGVNFKLGIAYATTDELMSNTAIRKALLLPFWLTGIVPALLGLYFGNGTVIVLSALLIGGAVGDFAMYKELKKLPDDWLIKDDPKLPRLYIYSPDRIGQ